MAQAASFLESLGPGGAIMLKAIAGGGGRGIRRVASAEDLPAAYERCRSEAERSFGAGELYAEVFLPSVRHVEVQVVGDGSGAVSHLWDRECSLQRRRQKLVETAPARGLPDELRQRLFEAATTMASARSPTATSATFEFLVRSKAASEAFFFIEANPRLQVEHTVTEAVTGLDLVALQIAIANGATLADLGVGQADVPAARGIAVQARVCLETIAADGVVRPASGVLEAYEPPSGPGVRVDGFGYAGYQTGANFDSLLAKTIVHVPTDDLAAAIGKAARALAEFRIAGVATNLPFLIRLLSMPAVGEGRIDTKFIDEHQRELAATSAAPRARFFEPAAGSAGPRRKLDRADPLAILEHGRDARRETLEAAGEPIAPEGTIPLRSPVQGTVVSLSAAVGEVAPAGRPVLVLEAMKMEHEVASRQAGVIRAFAVEVGDTVSEGDILAFVEPGEEAETEATEAVDSDLGCDPSRSGRGPRVTAC